MPEPFTATKRPADKVVNRTQPRRIHPLALVDFERPRWYSRVIFWQAYVVAPASTLIGKVDSGVNNPFYIGAASMIAILIGTMCWRGLTQLPSLRLLMTLYQVAWMIVWLVVTTTQYLNPRPEDTDSPQILALAVSHMLTGGAMRLWVEFNEEEASGERRSFEGFRKPSRWKPREEWTEDDYLALQKSNKSRAV